MPIEHEGRRSFVELEWVGVGETLERKGYRRGANSTSVDALVLGRAEGVVRAYLLEWKYVEEGGATVRGVGKAGESRRATYGPLYKRSGLFHAPFEDLLFEPVYQLMRFALLGRRMVERRELGVADFRLAVVCPDGNKAYRELEPANVDRLDGYGLLVDAMKKWVLKPEHAHRFSMSSQRDLVSAAAHSREAELGAWRAYLAERYGW